MYMSSIFVIFLVIFGWIVLAVERFEISEIFAHFYSSFKTRSTPCRSHDRKNPRWRTSHFGIWMIDYEKTRGSWKLISWLLIDIHDTFTVWRDELSTLSSFLTIKHSIFKARGPPYWILGGSAACFVTWIKMCENFGNFEMLYSQNYSSKNYQKNHKNTRHIYACCVRSSSLCDN